MIVDEEGAVFDRFGIAQKQLESLSLLDPELEKQVQRGQTAFYEIEELIEELRDYIHKSRI